MKCVEDGKEELMIEEATKIPAATKQAADSSQHGSGVGSFYSPYSTLTRARSLISWRSSALPRW